MGAKRLVGINNMLAGQGTHLLGEWYGCDFSAVALNDAESLRATCLDATRTSGLEIVGDAFHQFKPQGVTDTAFLAESHLAIHTWPEAGFVTVDVYVCNYLEDNTHKALALYAALIAHFQPAQENFAKVLRGRSHTDYLHDGVPRFVKVN